MTGEEEWIRAHVTPSGPAQVEHQRPWATVWRVPVDGGAVWFKACGPVQAFEAGLTAALASRWPDRLPEVIACDEDKAWLLLADAGTPLMAFGDQLDAWLAILPRYAELQQGEAAHVAEHLAGGVPDRRLEALPDQYEGLVARDLPLEPEEKAQLRAFGPAFARLCSELGARGIPPSIQHDDLHAANVYARDGRLAVLDWGDASVAHPFFSLVATLHNEARRVPFTRLRDAYLEPWGADPDTFELALRIGWFTYAIAWLRQYDHLERDEERADFVREFANVLRLAYSAAT
jgi:hypothetical protein